MELSCRSSCPPLAATTYSVSEPAAAVWSIGTTLAKARLYRKPVAADLKAAGWVSSKLIETDRIADMGTLVSSQLLFLFRRSNRHQTLAADRVHDAIAIVPVGECGSHLVGDRKSTR